MSALLMTERQPVSEYTWYGNFLDRLMFERGIKNPTQMYRQIEALGGYPRRLSPATVGNIMKGVQGAPFEFHQYATVALDKLKPLTKEEREELEDAYTWGQKHSPDAGYDRETIERAYDFVEEMRKKHRGEGGDQT